MRIFSLGALAVLMLTPAMWAQEKEKGPAQQEAATEEVAKDETPSPAQQYSKLVLEHRAAMNAFLAEYQKAKTNEERQKLMRESYPQPATYAPKFQQLAEQYPDDPVVEQAYGWILSNASGTPDSEKLAQILLDRAAKGPGSPAALDNLILIATRLRGRLAEEAAKFILQQAAQNPKDPKVLSRLITLASNPRAPAAEEAAKTLLEVASANKEDPAVFDTLASFVSRGRGEFAKKVTRFLIENYIDDEKLGMVCLRMMYSRSRQAEATLQEVIDKSSHPTVKGEATYALAKIMLRSGPGANREVEQLLESVLTDYGDINLGRRTLGQMAEGDLFELRNLQIGMNAPEIAGEDIDGQTFKLSDYKGKVVVLDFWGDW